MTNATKNNWVKEVSLAPPSLNDNRADGDRLISALQKEVDVPSIGIDLPLMQRLTEVLRKSNYRVRVVLFQEDQKWVITHLSPLDASERVLGIAIDLGTTRVVLRLIDLATLEVVGESAFDNPQIEIGPDVLTRIHFAAAEGGLNTLRTLIIDGLNNAIHDLVRGVEATPEQVCNLSIAGNTAMTHLFLGLDPHYIIREPYIPVMNMPGVLKARDVGLKVGPLARILVFPNIGSYFGGDLIAGMLYSGLHKSNKTILLVDVGTNAEVVFGNRNWLVGCAGAAGPALEGGAAKMGMMAGPGVIDSVSVDKETLAIHTHTIDDRPPLGICGSGLIDLVAQLFLNKMIDVRGKLSPAACGNRLVEEDGMRRLIIVPQEASGTRLPLYISQTDIDSLTRSKAAMYTILETLTASVGLTLDAIEGFHVAGTFGAFIKPSSAIAIGMLPDLPLSRFKALGNSSLGGATMVLTSSAHLTEIEEIRDRITYLELNVNQEFMNSFSAAKFYPHTDPKRFPSVIERLAQ